MRLPFHLVTLILFAVTATATPPPGHVHRPSDDKNPPSYQYGYEIGDVDGKESQGKVETRSGELASGRYYVNEEKSSTDVKYFADEWGYHPLVKYRAANDHSSATAHFALGEHVVKALLNGTEVGDEVKLPFGQRQSGQHNRQQSQRRRRPTQVVQPYTAVSPGREVEDSSSSSPPKSQPIDDHEPSATGTVSPVNLLLNYDLQRTFSRPSKFQDASTPSSAPSDSGFQENFNNYVTLPRGSANDRGHQRQSDVRAAYLSGSSASSSSTTPDYRSISRASIYVTNPSTTGSYLNGPQVDSHQENHDARHEPSNDLFSTLADDLLLVQNAGSFGRRLNPSASSSLPNVVDTLTRRVPTDHPYRSTSTTPRTSVSHPTELDDRRHFSTTPIPDFHDVANSVSAETLSKEYKNSFSRDNAATGSYADLFAKIFSNSPHNEVGQSVDIADSPSTENSPLVRLDTGEKNDSASADHATTPGLSAYGKRRDHELYVTLRQSLDTELRESSRSYSSTPQTLSTFSSKPIVVAELSNYNRDKGFEYSTTFPCTDDDYQSSTSAPGLSSTYESSIDSTDRLLVTPKPRPSSGHITTSSVVLNPIQAGLSLLNAGDTELIASSDRSIASPAPVNENIDDERSNDEALINFSANRINELEKIGTDRARAELYETINPAFGQTSGAEVDNIGESMKTTGAVGGQRSSVGSDLHDQRIEIQKSVEIYQNTPVHEIHYPPQVISQVSGIDHRVQQQQQQQQQQQREREDSVGAVHQGEEQSRSYVELHEVGNAKQFQQRYNGLHDQQHQSINGHTTFEDARGVHETEAVYRGNPVRVDNELTDYGAEQRNPLTNNDAGHDDHANIVKMIRERIPEVKYTPARIPQINVQVYGSTVGEDNNKGQGMETEQQIKAAQGTADAQVNKVQSQLHRILSESDGGQGYFSGAGWTRYQEQQGHGQEQLGHLQQQLQGYRQEQQQGNRQEQQQAHHQELQQAHRQEQQQALHQEQQAHYQEQQQAHRQEQQQADHQEQQQAHYQEQQQTHHQEQQQVHNQQQQQAQLHGPQESGKEPTYDSRAPQPHQQQSILLQYGQYDSSDKNHQQSYGNVAPVSYLPPSVTERIVQKIVHVPQPYPVEVPRIIEKKVPYPVEKIIERKVPYPVEKIVERKVPYPVEKIVEKKIPVPQPYPVHIQVPVDRIIEKQVQVPYPVHIEKIIEKKVPYPVQRLVPQPYPVHILQPYPVEKIVEKPVHIPITVEKIVEKKVRVPHPYPVQVPVKVPYPIELTKYVEQSVQVPYGVRYGVSYQQIMKPQSTNGLYAHQESTSLPIYGLTLVANQHRDRINASNAFQGYSYDKPSVAFVTGHEESGSPQRSNGWEQFAHGKISGSDRHHHHHLQAFAKKSYVGQSSKLPLLSHNYSLSNRRHASYRQKNLVGGDKPAGKEEYVGPVPAAQQQQQAQPQSPSKPHQKSRSRSSSDHQQPLLPQSAQQHSTLVTRTEPVSTSASSSRRARQQDENPLHYQSGPGAFRQSKIEYGFKPPMVPSIQYDEKTATKVDN